MRPFVLLLSFIGCMSLWPGSAMARAELRVCNQGTQVVNAVIAEHHILFGHAINGWVIIRPGECKEVWRTGSNVFERVFLGFSKPGKDNELGIYPLHIPRETVEPGSLRLSETNRVFCVNPGKGFRRLAKSYEALGPECSPPLRPMKFAVAVEIKQTRYTMDLFPKKDSPVISFNRDQPDRSTSRPSGAQKAPNKSEESARKIKQKLNEINISEGNIESAFCQSLNTVLSDSENSFQNFRSAKINAKETDETAFVSTKIIAGFHLCMLIDKKQSTEFACKQDIISDTNRRSILRGYAKMTSSCLNAKPKFSKNDNLVAYGFNFEAAKHDFALLSLTKNQVWLTIFSKK